MLYELKLNTDHLKAHRGRHRQRLKLELYWRSDKGEKCKRRLAATIRQTVTKQYGIGDCGNCGATLTTADADAWGRFPEPTQIRLSLLRPTG